jgi:hypothetical protein
LNSSSLRHPGMLKNFASDNLKNNYCGRWKPLIIIIETNQFVKKPVFL